METGQIVTGTIFFVGLASSLVGLYIKMVTDSAIAREKHLYLQTQVNKLETRINEIEDNAVLKIDRMQESLQKMEVNIAKLLNK